MVVFVDLEEDDDEPHLFGRHLALPHHHHQQERVELGRKESYEYNHGCKDGKQKSAEAVNRHAALFASALACYPVSLSLATHLDLIDLFALSSTCRSIHNSITQFAHQLRGCSLRCINDEEAPPLNIAIDNEDVGEVFRMAIHEDLAANGGLANTPAFPLPFSSDGSHFHGRNRSALGLTGRIGQCARDMVAPCRKCGCQICRNCAVKPPSDRCLPERFRRLCQTCLEAPLMAHLQPYRNDVECSDSPPLSSASSARSFRSTSHGSQGSQVIPRQDQEFNMSFSTPAFLRQPCTCSTRGVYLCQPCGQNLHASDTTYKRVWTWRSRYSTHIGGGLGTGLGLGNQGQKCARGDHCLEKGASGVCWVEIECSETRAQSYGKEDRDPASTSGTPNNNDFDGGISTNKPGYFSQEIEGIGGVVKKKVKKRVKVGATVYEYDDERGSGKYLEREATGKQRGYCGWCSRVCPDDKDKAMLGNILK